MVAHAGTFETRTSVDEVIVDAGTHTVDMVVLKVHGSGNSWAPPGSRIFVDDHGPA
jgi:hypothetical protein